jgi:hypothetical protein
VDCCLGRSFGGFFPVGTPVEVVAGDDDANDGLGVVGCEIDRVLRRLSRVLAVGDLAAEATVDDGSFASGIRTVVGDANVGVVGVALPLGLKRRVPNVDGRTSSLDAGSAEFDEPRKVADEPVVAVAVTDSNPTAGAVGELAVQDAYADDAGADRLDSPARLSILTSASASASSSWGNVGKSSIP